MVADDISAYDTEAAERYARESLEEVREDIANADVDLGFADGSLRGAAFVLPSEIDADATVTGGEPGDPRGTMAQGEFEIEVAATVEFDVEAPANASSEQIVALARALLAESKAVNSIAFDDGCMGSKLKLAAPIHVALAASGS